jgi:DUF177 domain-containing protein
MSALKESLFVDPRLSASRGHVEEGVLPVKGFNLPLDILANEEGELKFRLAFARNEERLIYIEGRMEADLNLCCQRCLQSLPHQFYSEFKISPVSTEAEAMNLSSDFEAVFMENGKISIMRILEEELILGLPMVPLHAVQDGKCV